MMLNEEKRVGEIVLTFNPPVSLWFARLIVRLLNTTGYFALADPWESKEEKAYQKLLIEYQTAKKEFEELVATMKS